jgi:integrase
MRTGSSILDSCGRTSQLVQEMIGSIANISRHAFARIHRGVSSDRGQMLRLRAIDDPANIGIAPRLLGHRTRSTTERYYNQARSVGASRLMQSYLLALRYDNRGAADPKDRIL